MPYRFRLDQARAARRHYLLCGSGRNCQWRPSASLERMRAVSFFAGIGGFDIALRHQVDTVGFVELDAHCRRVLERRFPGVAWRHDDIGTLAAEAIPDADVWMGGFPCQGISPAGKGLGLEDDRSGLWHTWAALIKARRPQWVFIENHPRLRLRGLQRVLEDLHEAGYDARWQRFSAWDAGAWHWRERVWILAGPRGTCTAPGLIGLPLDHALGPDGVMVNGTHHDIPAVTSGKPPVAAALPTPSAVEYGSSQNGVNSTRPSAGTPSIFTLARKGALPTAVTSDSKGSLGLVDGRGRQLRDEASRGVLPTPNARDWRSGKGRQPNGHAPQLPEVMGGVLNPAWEEPFMGFPIGWTDPDVETVTELDLPAAWLSGEWIDQAPSPTVPPRSLPGRRERVHSLGNAVVPEACRRAWHILRGDPMENEAP